MERESNKAYLLTWDNEVARIKPDNGTDFTLEELQSLVGGYIEIVKVGTMVMVTNEDGKRDGDYNAIATMVADTAGVLRRGDYIAGDAVYCPSAMVR